jgi:hypothetical protein
MSGPKLGNEVGVERYRWSTCKQTWSVATFSCLFLTHTTQTGRPGDWGYINTE